MSAKDANPAGEVGKANNKDGDLIESPNITHASADESEPYIDAKEEARKAARKKAETVEIDGVPIDEKDLKFKAGDIKRKGADDYFVNVDRREIEKKERRQTKVEESARKKEASRSRAQKIQQQVKDFFFKGWHKTVFIGIIIAIILGGAGYAIWYKATENERLEAERTAAEAAKISEANQVERTLLEKITNEAKKAEEDLPEAIAGFDELISETESDADKSKIYLYKSQTIFKKFNNKVNNSYEDEIYDSAVKAYELDKDNEAALDWVIAMATHFGRNDDLAKYKPLKEQKESDAKKDTRTTEGRG